MPFANYGMATRKKSSDSGDHFFHSYVVELHLYTTLGRISDRILRSSAPYGDLVNSYIRDDVLFNVS